ncbi:MAG TPA: MarR family transcriptional regulator [Candidatus Paceibacterota bacterium]|nr:MarR family transcriptional regulator [Candidatus Paceibacterota bacterium]
MTLRSTAVLARSDTGTSGERSTPATSPLAAVKASLAEYMLIMGRVQALTKAIKEATDRTPTQCLILVALLEKDGVNQTNLGKRTGIQRSCLAECVTRMVRKELLLRSDVEGDSRPWSVTLTNRGRAVARKLVIELGHLLPQEAE